MDLVRDAHHAGARLEKACEAVGLSLRALQRWKNDGGGEDRRRGPRTAPANKLEDHEIDEILRVINLPEYRDLPPSQIVPRLADLGRYLASEATIYRILRSVGQLAHRSRSKPATVHRPGEHVATGPNQVFSWDITYLKAAARGTFYYLYLVQDVFSRKIVGWAVHDR
jgi:transposase InsO family protein